MVIRKPKKSKAVLTNTPTVKEAQASISPYLNLIQKDGKSVTVTSRGKPVAILAPRDKLPPGRFVRASVSATEIARGKRSFGSVVHHGPYSVTRNGIDVAVLYCPEIPPSQSIEKALFDLVDAVERIELVKHETERRVQIRQRCDAAIRARVSLLERSGDAAAARQLQEQFDRIDLA